MKQIFKQILHKMNKTSNEILIQLDNHSVASKVKKDLGSRENKCISSQQESNQFTPILELSQVTQMTHKKISMNDDIHEQLQERFSEHEGSQVDLMDHGTSVIVSATGNLQHQEFDQQTILQKDSGAGIDLNIQDFIQSAQNYLQHDQEDAFQVHLTSNQDGNQLGGQALKREEETTDEINSNKSNHQFWSVGAKQKIMGNNLLPFPASKKLLRNHFMPKIGDHRKQSNSKQNSPRIIAQEVLQNQNGIFVEKKSNLNIQEVGSVQLQPIKTSKGKSKLSFMQKKADEFVAPPNTRFFKHRRNTTTLQPLRNQQQIIESPRDQSVMSYQNQSLHQKRVNIPQPQFKQRDSRNMTSMDKRELRSPLNLQLGDKQTVNLNVVVDESPNRHSNFESQTDQTAIDAKSHINKSTYLSGALNNPGSPQIEEIQVANFKLQPDQNFGIQSPVRKTITSEQSQTLNLFLNTEGISQIPRIRLEAIENERRKNLMKDSHTSAQAVNALHSQLQDAQAYIANTDQSVNKEANRSTNIETVDQPSTLIKLANLEESMSKKSGKMTALLLQPAVQLQNQQYIIAVAKECSQSRTSNSQKGLSPNGSPKTLRNTSIMTGNKAKFEINQVKPQIVQQVQQPEVFISSKVTFSPRGVFNQDSFKSSQKCRFSSKATTPRATSQTQEKTQKSDAAEPQRVDQKRSKVPLIWNQNNAFLKEKISDYQHHIPQVSQQNKKKLIEINDSNKNFAKQTESKDTMKGLKYNYQKQGTGGLTQTELANSIHEFHENEDASKQKVWRDVLVPSPQKFIQPVLDNQSIYSQQENNVKAFSQKTLPQNNISQQSLKKDGRAQPIQQIDGKEIVEAAREQTPQSETGSPVSPKRMTSKIFQKADQPLKENTGLTLKVVNMNNADSQPNKIGAGVCEKRNSGRMQNKSGKLSNEQHFGALKTQNFPIDPSFEHLSTFVTKGEGMLVNKGKETARSFVSQIQRQQGYLRKNQLIPKFNCQSVLTKKLNGLSQRQQNSSQSKKFDSSAASPKRDLSEMRSSIDQAFQIFENYAKAGKDLPLNQTSDDFQVENYSNYLNLDNCWETHSQMKSPRDKIVIGGQNLFEFAVGGMTAPIQQKVLQIKSYQLPLGQLPEDHKFIEAHNKLLALFSDSEINKFSNFLNLIQQLILNKTQKKQIISEIINLQKQALIGGIQFPTSYVIQRIQREHPWIQDSLAQHLGTIQDSSSMQIHMDTNYQLEDADSLDQNSMGSPFPTLWRPPATAEIVKKRTPIYRQGQTRVQSGNFRGVNSQQPSETRNMDSVNNSKAGEFKGDNMTINISKQGDNADSFLDGLSGGRILKHPVVKTKLTSLEKANRNFRRGARSIEPTPKNQRVINVDRINFEQMNKDPAIGNKQQKLVQDVIQSLVTGNILENQKNYRIKQVTKSTYSAQRHYCRGMAANSNLSAMSRFSSTG